MRVTNRSRFGEACSIFACLLGCWPALLGAAGMDDSTNRLRGSDFETTDNTSRFTYPGSVELDNGLIVKWGQATVAAFTNRVTVTYAEAFPSGVLSVEVTPVALTGGDVAAASVENSSTSQFEIKVQCVSLTGVINCSNSRTVRWSARGY